MLAFAPLPRSAGFDTLSGHFPVFPDYLAEKRVFIDWELIKRGPPLTLPRFAFAKGEGRFDVEAIHLSGRQKHICCGVSVVPSSFFLSSSCTFVC